jgi:hypothetical protein
MLAFKLLCIVIFTIVQLSQIFYTVKIGEKQ